VREPSFYSWRRELAQRDGRQRGPQLLPVELISGPISGSAALEIELPGPVKLRVPPGCDLELLRQALLLLLPGREEAKAC
jgi:hypothetical protein